MSDHTQEPSNHRDIAIPAACARVSALLPALAADRLDPAAEREVLEHLATCLACAQRFEAAHAAVLRLVGAAPLPAPPIGLRESMYARIAASGVDAVSTRQPAREAGNAHSDAERGDVALGAHDAQDSQPRSISGHPRHRSTIWVSTVAAALVVALLASVLVFAAHGRSPTAGHRLETPPATSCAPQSITVSLPSHAQITKLAMVSPTDGWALGSIAINGGASFQPFLARFQRCRWSPAPALPISNAVLDDLAMPSATDGWAVGHTTGGTQSRYVLLHYSGGRWISTTLPPPIPQQGAAADAISYVRMLSADEGWLVAYWGDSEADTSFHLYHYLHGVWSYVAAPLASISDVAPVGPDEAWILGTQSVFGGETLLAHDIGGRWSTQSAPLANGAGSFQVASPTDIILTGLSAAPTRIISLRFDGTSWRTLDTGLAPSADGVQYFSGNEGWSYSYVVRGNAAQPMLTPARHLASGVWTTVGWPFPNDVVFPPLVHVGPGDFWAVGMNVSGPSKTSWTPVFFHYTGGTWYAYS